MKRNIFIRLKYEFLFLDIFVLFLMVQKADFRKLRSVDKKDLDTNPLTNSVEFIWSTTTVAVGDTAVLHCSFDAIFQQLRNGNIDWSKETNKLGEWEGSGGVVVASGKRVTVEDSRLRVFRPHNSALSVLIIRRSKKRDAGIYRCNLSGSSTRHKYMILNVTESKIEAQTSPATMRAKIGNDVTLWCNATGYPKPVVYWTRDDRNRQLPDGSYQFWGNGLQVRSASESDTGVYTCYLDNFVQPIVTYKFSLMVEDNPWNLDGYKMRFDSRQWYAHDRTEPKPIKTKSYLLMCEARGASKPQPLIRWFKDGKAIRNSKHFYIITDSPDSKSNKASSTLVVMNFLPRFQGNYTCVASNVFRMKKLTFYIRDFLESDDVENTTSSELDVKLSLPKVIRHPDKQLPNSIAIDTVRKDRTRKTDLKQTLNAKNLLHGFEDEKPKGKDIGRVRGRAEMGQVNQKTVTINVPAEAVYNDDDDDDEEEEEDLMTGSGNRP